MPSEGARVESQGSESGGAGWQLLDQKPVLSSLIFSLFSNLFLFTRKLEAPASVGRGKEVHPYVGY